MYASLLQHEDSGFVVAHALLIVVLQPRPFRCHLSRTLNLQLLHRWLRCVRLDALRKGSCAAALHLSGHATIHGARLRKRMRACGPRWRHAVVPCWAAAHSRRSVDVAQVRLRQRCAVPRWLLG